MACVMSGKMGFSEEDRRKNAGLTVVLAVLCALGVILPRSFGSSATVIMAGGRPFAYTDAFIILAAGIGGLPAGILTFSIAFVAEAVSSSNFYSIYTMSIYILIMLIASGLAYGRCYAGIKRLPVPVLILTASLVCLWEITTVHARRQNPYSKNAVLEYAREIQDSGRMLLSIINDILDFSKIEAGKMDIVPAEYSTGSMINELVSMVAPRAEAKGLLLHVNAAPDLPRKLFGDDNRIKQCVLNLLTNAVKYTREGSVTLLQEGTPPLLEHYRACGIQLEPLVRQ